MHKSLIPVFYVVTRAGRRTTPSDFWTYDQADREAQRLRSRLSKWKDKDFSKVEIIRTCHPESII